jgi:alpha-mannosidase
MKFEVRPTVFFVEKDGFLNQILKITVDSPNAAGAAELQGRWENTEVSFPLGKIAAGKNSFEVPIPEVREPAQAVFELKAGTQKAVSEVRLVPQRKWTVYLLPHSHTDIGFTALQGRVLKNHVAYLDDVIRFCRDTDNYPEAARFKWNIEAGWSLDQFLRRRSPDQIEELARLLREGRVELSAWYLNLTDLFGHEELIRSVYSARSAARRFGFNVASAMNNDVTGFSWAVPQILRGAGVKYFATGINETRSRAPLRRPCAFWWEAPDGSRILHWNGEHYMFANFHLDLHLSADAAKEPVADYLAGLQDRGDYALDIIAFNISGSAIDNAPPNKALSDIVRDWNSRWAWPKLRLAVMREFFEDLEARYGTGLPVYRLGWPDYWTDGVASTAYETGLIRLTHDRLRAAESFAAFASSLDSAFPYPREEIEEAYQSALLFDEHTWGSGGSIRFPDSEQARGQWAVKSAFAYAASEGTGHVLQASLDRMAFLIPTDGRFTFAVFNPLPWTRSDVIRLVMPGRLAAMPEPLRLRDKRNGQRLPCQIDRENNILYFLARDMPALGYAVFTFAPAENKLEAKPGTIVQKSTIENEYYRVTLDPQSGGLISLFDKQLQVELVDPSSPYRLNQYIHELPKGGRPAVDNMEKLAEFDRASPASAVITPGLQGPVAYSLIVRTSARMCPRLEQEIILYDGLKRVDIINRLDKEETLAPEAVYFAFPFQVKGGTFRLEIADAVLKPEAEQLPGTVRDWYAVQNWVEVANNELSVVWAPVEAPLVQLGDINTGKWLTRLDPANAWIFSYAMNNYWMTNFKAGQGGRVNFRYAITSRPGGPDTVLSTHFGWEAHSPLIVQGLPSGNRGTLPGDSLSLLSLDQPNILVQAVKRAEDGQGLVVRLREIAGRKTTARLRSFLFPPEGPVLENLGIAEDKGETATVAGDLGVVTLSPYEIKTTRIKNIR